MGNITVKDGTWTLRLIVSTGVPMTISNATASGFSYSIGNGGPQNQSANENANNGISINGPGGKVLTGFVCNDSKISWDCAAATHDLDATQTWEADYVPPPDEEYNK